LFKWILYLGAFGNKKMQHIINLEAQLPIVKAKIVDKGRILAKLKSIKTLLDDTCLIEKGPLYFI
jgi:hypothetical protein